METNIIPAKTVITVADLTLRVDERVATYKLGDRTYTVLVCSHGFTVPQLIESVKMAGTETDLDPWVTKSAYDAGIHLNF